MLNGVGRSTLLLSVGLMILWDASNDSGFYTRKHWTPKLLPVNRFLLSLMSFLSFSLFCIRGLVDFGSSPTPSVCFYACFVFHSTVISHTHPSYPFPSLLEVVSSRYLFFCSFFPTIDLLVFCSFLYFIFLVSYVFYILAWIISLCYLVHQP